MDARLERFADISGYGADILAAPDVLTATLLFRGLLHRFGYDTFSCGEADVRDHRRSVFYVIDWPTEFAVVYHAADLIAVCPIMRALAVFDRPYCWDDMRDMCFQTKGSWRLLEAARAHGWDDGLVVPLPRGGARKGIISMMGQSANLRVEDRPLVAALAMIYYERVRGILAGSTSLVSAARLITSEIACLRLLASGLPEAVLAERLLISLSAVHDNIQNARMKLGAKTRAEAVAIVVSLGLVVV